MVEWLIKRTKTYKSLEEDIENYCEEMQRKQTKINNYKRDTELLNGRLTDYQNAANKIIEEKQREINDLINKLELENQARKSLAGKVGSLGRKIKKLEKELEDTEERVKYWRDKSV